MNAPDRSVRLYCGAVAAEAIARAQAAARAWDGDPLGVARLRALVRLQVSLGRIQRFLQEAQHREL